MSQIKPKKKPCKNCKELDYLRHGLCTKNGCYNKWLLNTPEGRKKLERCTIKAHREVEKTKRIELRERKKSVRKITKKKEFYSSSAWLYCSRYVKLYYSEDGYCRCSTSPHRNYPVNDPKLHCGHYLKFDQHKATAFEFKNLAPQSYTDNIKFSGKPEIMAEWLKKQHGNDVIEWLNIKKNEECHLDAATYEYWADHYKKLFNELIKTKGNPWKRN